MKRKDFLLKTPQDFAKLWGRVWSGKMKKQKNLGMEARRRESKELESGTERWAVLQ